MKRKLEAIELGATLFIPANHKQLEAILFKEKYPQLRSVVIDFEDGLNEDTQDEALASLKKVLEHKEVSKLLAFIRPRNGAMLKTLTSMENINRINGFVLPKFGLENMDAYLSHLKDFYFMPSIEGLELFDVKSLQSLRNVLLSYKEQIILIRFGAEDMMKQLGLKRNCEESLFDLHVTSHIISNIIMIFKPYGFDIAAPVYPCFKDCKNYMRQISQEFKAGLRSKTIIHPNQIAPLHRLYRVSEDELLKAETLLQSSDVVVGYNGEMLERNTQLQWAVNIMKRSKIYGIM